MNELKNAYDILGVKQDATRVEIEKRYDILLKRYHAMKISGELQEEDEREWNHITEAYRELTDYKSKSSMEPEPISPTHVRVNKMIQKVGLDDKRVNNFFHYHKYHILIGIAMLVVLAVSIGSCVMRVDPDVNLTFLGDFYIQDTNILSEKIKSSLPEIKAPGIDVITLSKEPVNPQMDYTMRMKAIAILTAGEVDVLILDKEQYKSYGEQGVLENLDGLADEIGIDEAQRKGYILKDKESGEEHLYGIDISNSKILKDINMVGKEKIVAIRFNAKNHDKAVKLLKLLAK